MIVNGSPTVGRTIKQHRFGAEIEYFHSKGDAMKEYYKLLKSNSSC